MTIKINRLKFFFYFFIFCLSGCYSIRLLIWLLDFGTEDRIENSGLSRFACYDEKLDFPNGNQFQLTDRFG